MLLHYEEKVSRYPHRSPTRTPKEPDRSRHRPARRLTHARILLKADQSPEGPGGVDEQVAEAVEVSQPTVSRVRKQYV